MDITISYVLSQIFIIINYVLLIITYQLKNRKSILLFNFAGLIATCLSFAMLEVWSGLLTSVIAIIRNVIFWVSESKRKQLENATYKDIILLIIIYIMLLVSLVITYSNIWSVLPAVTTMVYTYSIWQKDTSIYKILGIVVSILSITYSVYIFSVCGALLEAIMLVSAIVGIIRSLNKKTKKYIYS